MPAQRVRTVRCPPSGRAGGSAGGSHRGRCSPRGQTHWTATGRGWRTAYQGMHHSLKDGTGKERGGRHGTPPASPLPSPPPSCAHAVAPTAPLSRPPSHTTPRAHQLASRLASPPGCRSHSSRAWRPLNLLWGKARKSCWHCARDHCSAAQCASRLRPCCVGPGRRGHHFAAVHRC